MSLFKFLATVVAGLLLLAGAATAQPLVRSFDGDKGPGLAVCRAGATHCDRAEMNVAASGTQVVQVTWQSVSVYDHDGRLVKSTPMPAFVRSAGLEPMGHKGQSPFEPQIVYDEFIERWIVTVTCLNDCVLVSASSDATGPWGGSYLSCARGGPCLDFDPGIHVGYDRNGVYVCAAHMGDDNPHTVPGTAHDCFAVPPAEVRAIAAGTPPVHVNRIHNMPLDLFPAVDHNPEKPATAPALFATKSCERARAACQRSANFPFQWLVSTFTWNGSTGGYGGLQVIKTDVGSARDKWLYNTPCCGETMSIPQKGSEITLRAATSHRIMNLVQSGSHLQAALTTGPCTEACGPQGTDTNNLMIWVDLDCSTPEACVVSRTAKISSPAVHAEFGTVGVDSAGNTGIVGTSSTGSTNLSVLLWTRRQGEDAFEGPITVASGTQPYTCSLGAATLVPMGNSAGVLTALDPADGRTLWATQQYASDATPCVWNTRIVRYQVAPAGARPPSPKPKKPKRGGRP